MGFLRYLNYVLFTLILGLAAPAAFLMHPEYALAIVLVVFTVVFAIITHRSMERREDLRLNVDIELSRLRRLHHVAEGMSQKAWRYKLDDALTQYQLILSQDLRAYDEANAAYRDISHLIYNFTPKIKREELLMAEMLETTREIALGRQKIQGALKTRLEIYYWIIIVVLALLVIGSFVFLLDGEVFSRITFACAVLSIFLALDVLRFAGRQNGRGLARFQQAYQVNIPSKQEPLQE